MTCSPYWFFEGEEGEPFTIPLGTNRRVVMVARGASAAVGGKGALVTATIPVARGDVFTAIVGSEAALDGIGGFPDGGDGGAYEPGTRGRSGGGSTTILKNGVPVLVAGGGATGGPGGTPDGEGTAGDVHGVGATETTPGGGGTTVYDAEDGEPGDTDGIGQGGDGGDGSPSHLDSATTGSTTMGNAAGSGIPLMYVSGPKLVVPSTIPPHGYVDSHLTEFTSTPAPGGSAVFLNYFIPRTNTQLPSGARSGDFGPGDLAIGTYVNPEDFDEPIEEWWFCIGGPSHFVATLSNVYTADMAPGDGGGGGRHGGGGGAGNYSTVGLGGPGSSWVDPSATDVLFQVAPDFGDGLAQVCYDPREGGWSIGAVKIA